MILRELFYYMGGGKERKESLDLQKNLITQQSKVANDYLSLAAKEQERRTALQQPSIDYYTKILSTDPSTRMAAVAAPIGDIAKSAESARGAIEETVPRGAARQYALAANKRDQYSQSADFLNKAYNNAFPALASMGTEAGNVGLQQTGAGLRGAESALSGNAGIMDMQQKQKASQLGVIGSLAGGVAGGLAGKKWS